MAQILIVYSTTDGHTQKVCARIQDALQRQAHAVCLLPVAEAPADLSAFDKVVIGAAIRYGKHKPEVFDFVRRHRATLDARPSAFFTVNIVARKPEKNTPATNPYMKKFLLRTGWQPKVLGVFAGKLDYPRYRFIDRLMIRFIMLITDGPTDPATVAEFTDWQTVASFAGQVDAM